MFVTENSTDIVTYFKLRLTATGLEATGLTITDIDLQYVRSGAAPSAKVDATALAATDSAHADGKAIEIDATDQPGVYRVDWPDAAFATGVPEVILTVKHASCFTEDLRVTLTSAAAVDSNVVDMDAAIENEIAAAVLSAANSAPIAASVMTTGGNPVLIAAGTIGATGNDATHLHLPGLTFGNDELNDYAIRVLDVSTGEYYTVYITDWVLGTELATVETLPFTPEDSVDTYAILGPKRTAPAVVVGTVDTGATSTVIPTSALAPAASSTNQFAGRVIIFDNDTATAGLRGSGGRIASSTTGGQITLETADALSSAPASGDRFRIF